MNATLETLDDRPVLRLERRLRHPIERVWRAVTDPAELERWFLGPVKWRPEAGETFEAHGQAGEITELRAPRVIAWTYGGELFRFDLEEDGEGCVLVFTHVFDERALSAQHATGWEAYFKRLDAHLAGGFLSEADAHEGASELHERYAERFGLDPEVGRAIFAKVAPSPVTLESGPVLRFERRYEHPVERVWMAITDSEELSHWFPPGEELKVTESSPPHLLAGTWYGHELRFELEEDGEGCLLVFTHAIAERDTAARDAAGWDVCFERLQALLTGEPLSESDSLARWPAKHERYAERFGVDPRLGREAFARNAARE